MQILIFLRGTSAGWSLSYKLFIKKAELFYNSTFLTSMPLHIISKI